MANPLISLERETGFEPATSGLEGHCSGQLSYSRISGAEYNMPTSCKQTRFGFAYSDIQTS